MTEIRKVKRVYKYVKYYNKKEVLDILENSVYCSFKFNSHINETAQKLNLPEDVVMQSVKSMIEFICITAFTTKIPVMKFLIPYFLKFIINNSIENKNSVYYKENLEKEFDYIKINRKKKITFLKSKK